MGAQHLLDDEHPRRPGLRDRPRRHARRLAAEGIDTRPTFPLISTYPIWPERRAVAAPVARMIGDRGINLPSGVRLRRDQVARIGAAIRRAVAAPAVRTAA